MTTTRQRPASTMTAPAARPIESNAAGRFLLRALFWTGLVLAVLPWWFDTPAGSLDTTAKVFEAGGRITGLIAGYVLLVQVILMSRLPMLERWIGTRHLTLWHRELGGFVLISILTHASLITASYAHFDQRSIPAEAWFLVSTYEDMVPAAIAAGMLVCVGLLSLRALRRAVPYEFWYYLHLTSYLALFMAYGHQFAGGSELFKPGLGRYAFITFYMVAIVAIVVGRLARPLWLNLRHRLRVAEVVPEGPDMVSIYVTGHRLGDLDAVAGQFFRWRFLGPSFWWQAHPFSLSAAPNGKWLRLTVKTVGDHTAKLRGLRAGTPIYVEGPWGDFTAARRVRSRALLIAAGSGIAPVRALLEELPAGAVLIYRASVLHELTLREELEHLAQVRHATLWFVVGSRRDAGPRYLFTPRGMKELVPDITERDIYLCGPDGLVEASMKVMRRLRVPRRQVHLDPFEF
jgi:predicted ferric reductase